MTVSLYDMTVGTYQQILGSLDGILTKTRQHFDDDKAVLDGIVSMTLHEDMLPFEFQVKATIYEAMPAIRGAQKGTFSPPPPSPDSDFDGLCELVKQAQEELKTVTPEEISALEGSNVRFAIGEQGIDFLAEDFLLTFALPNFYFHATTTYDLLRMKGVPLGKRDFLGQMRIKG
ncbi:MAG: DUF1993 domain-containing protein [Oceanicoccus sp.]